MPTFIELCSKVPLTITSNSAEFEGRQFGGAKYLVIRLLEEGSFVPSDCSLIEVFGLRVNPA